MKWYASSSSVATRVVSSTKGEERAKELWTVRINSELERTSPRSYLARLVHLNYNCYIRRGPLLRKGMLR